MVPIPWPDLNDWSTVMLLSRTIWMPASSLKSAACYEGTGVPGRLALRALCEDKGAVGRSATGGGYNTRAKRDGPEF